ncbi:WLM domain-containing protein [Xylaria nigripes]|nr:WLM domain-containing protein [Xylaria nigripes]
MVLIALFHHGKEYAFGMMDGATVADLAVEIQDALDIPIKNQKLIVAKLGTLKAPFPDRPVTDLEKKKITLIGSTSEEVNSMILGSHESKDRQARRNAALKSAPKPYTTQHMSTSESQYTFSEVRPLPHLPHAERSLRLLERLKADPAIRNVMSRHRFSVGLLTEMDPLSYTESNHEGTTRILGLNRNKGEVIELRLRTDAYDGYRDYKTIRLTLCHELAHNMFGPHNRDFWDYCHQIEREVAEYDRSEHRLDNSEVYQPSPEIACDDGGWTGGEYVLGGSGPSGARGSDDVLTRREILANAAEARLKKLREGEAEGDADADTLYKDS